MDDRLRQTSTKSILLDQLSNSIRLRGRQNLQEGAAYLSVLQNHSGDLLGHVPCSGFLLLLRHFVYSHLCSEGIVGLGKEPPGDRSMCTWG